MKNSLRNADSQVQITIFFIATIITFYIAAFMLQPFSSIAKGMYAIIFSRDILITDYFVIAGPGAAFFNAALVMSFTLLVLWKLKVHYSGITIATVMIMGGFALFGKNLINILPILFGTCLYAFLHKTSPSKYIYTAFLATGVAPIVSELVFILPFSIGINTAIAFGCGVLIGFIVPVLAAHTVTMHLGYNLFNVGFAVGIIALCLVSLTRSFGFISQTQLLWQQGRPFWLVCFCVGYFLSVIFYGLYLSSFNLKPAFHLLKHPGRAIADFILMDGTGPTFINMGVIGMVGTGYILFIKGDFNGPVVGAILTIFGFAALGIHIKNYWPVLAGVYISTLMKVFSATTPSLQLAALFCAALCPIAGQFGIIAGLFAGFLHASIVNNVGGVYTGLNLYNNGFAAGFVAIIMLPLIEAFIKRFSEK